MQIISIGRDAGNTVILNNNYVSRRHAQLIVSDNGQISIKDLGSSNGTFVNGNKIKEAYLLSGDQVKCADTLLNWQQYVYPVSNEVDFSRDQTYFQSEHRQSAHRQPEEPVISNNYQQNIVIVGKQKSVGVAFLLAFLFGPLGLLYASVAGGVLMFFVNLIALFLFFPALFITWIVCIIWAVIAAGSANKNAIARSQMR